MILPSLIVFAGVLCLLRQESNHAALAFTTPHTLTIQHSIRAFGTTRRNKVSVALSPDHVNVFQDFVSNALTLADASLDAASASAPTGVEDSVVSAISDGATAAQQVTSVENSANPLIEGGTRGLSYYSTLALYALSFPGLWSTIKRSTSAKIKRKTYVSPGPEASNGKDSRQQAGEIMAYMKANNYEVADTSSEVITFRGIVARSKGQAFFLTFCTALGMASLALVLQIQFIDMKLPLIGTPNWFYLVLLSPYAGIYYWRSGDRVDDVKVKLVSSDDGMENEIVVEGNEEELDRFWRTLELTEKGMVKVEGVMS